MDQATVDAAMNMAALRDKEDRPEAYAINPSFAGVVAVPETTDTPLSHPIPTIERGTLRAMLEGAVLTMSKDPTRPHLHGVLFEFDIEGLAVTSTDGHRLTRTTGRYFGGNAPVLGVATKLLIPADQATRLLKALKCPVKLADRVLDIELGDGFSVELDGATHRLTATDDNFPPYEKVIPKERDKDGTNGCNAITVSSVYMGDVAKAAKHLANPALKYPVSWTVDGNRDPIRVDMRNQNAGTETVIVIMPMRAE
jgi:hypothetical protein